MRIETTADYVQLSRSNAVHVQLFIDDPIEGDGFVDNWMCRFDFERNHFICVYGRHQTTHKVMQDLVRSLDNGVRHTEYYDG